MPGDSAVRASLLAMSSISAAELQLEGSYRGNLTAPFGVSLPAKYPPGIPWSFTTEICSPSCPATPLPTEFLRLSEAPTSRATTPPGRPNPFSPQTQFVT